MEKPGFAKDKSQEHLSVQWQEQTCSSRDFHLRYWLCSDTAPTNFTSSRETLPVAAWPGVGRVFQPSKTVSCTGGFSFELSDRPQLTALTSLPLPGSLSDIKEVFPHHLLRLHHLDCGILLLDGLVGTPGKTLIMTSSPWCFFCLPSGSPMCLLSETVTTVLHLTR